MHKSSRISVGSKNGYLYSGTSEPERDRSVVGITGRTGGISAAWTGGKPISWERIASPTVRVNKVELSIGAELARKETDLGMTGAETSMIGRERTMSGTRPDGEARYWDSLISPWTSAVGSIAAA